jgi:type II secretory pathway component PulM
MNWNDYETLWKRQELPLGAKADLSAIRRTFEEKRLRLERGLSLWHAVEGWGSVLIALVYAYSWWRLGRDAWPMGFSIALTLGVSAVFMRERIVARRFQIGSEAPLLSRTEAYLGRLRHQRRVLLNIGTWYFVPLLLGGVLAARTAHGILSRRDPPGFTAAVWADPAARAWFIVLVGVTAAATVLAWASIRRDVGKRLDPRIEELEKLRREITADGEPHSPAGQPEDNSVGMTKLKILYLAVPTALLGVFLLFWHLSSERREAGDARLIQLAAENARLRDENLKLAKSVKALGLAGAVAPSAAAAAPVRSAARATESRQTVALAGGLAPVDTLGNAGRATARNAFATQLWAARTGDIALEASTLTFGPEARARLEALAATLPDDLRNEYDTPEKLMAYMLAGSPHPVGGMQVLGEVDVDANDVTLQTEWQHVDDDIVHQSDVNLVQGADGWRMVVPYSLVNRASNYLARTMAPPAANPAK